MGERIDDGGPAFPAEAFAAQHCPGMSLRDWIAGQFAPALVAELYTVARNEGRQVENIRGVVAEVSYDFADAMLAARSRSSSVEG